MTSQDNIDVDAHQPAAGPGISQRNKPVRELLRHRPQLQFDLASAINHCQRLAQEDVALGLRYGNPPWLVHSHLNQQPVVKTKIHAHPAPASSKTATSINLCNNRAAKEKNCFARDSSAAKPKPTLSAAISAAIALEAKKFENGLDDGLDHFPCKQGSEIEIERKRAELILDDIKHDMAKQHRKSSIESDLRQESIKTAHKRIKDILRTGQQSIQNMHQPNSVVDAECQATHFAKSMLNQLDQVEKTLTSTTRKDISRSRLSNAEVCALTNYILEELLSDTVQILSANDSQRSDNRSAQDVGNTVEDLDRERYRIARNLFTERRSPNLPARLTNQLLAEAQAELQILSRYTTPDATDFEKPIKLEESQVCCQQFHEYVRSKNEGFHTSFGILPQHLVELTASSVIEEAIETVADELQAFLGDEIELMAKEELTPLSNLRIEIQ